MNFPFDDFREVLTANQEFMKGFQHSELTGTAN
jgi:hypothetical protein